ncbi:hypothetical protein [Empedobacter falsenii]|uniref:Uncharacterized protein n=1 Tax=Empedobacter falsenii TaxID=343874 RepID=A0AAW7DII2_9FLAO|nr:hypothetical protein [Empedobacter falsenii]MDM1551345.1 hypothetical protein [Empedobacter falsenii]
MEKEIITKTFTYKGYTKTFSAEVQPLPPFNPETMDRVKYEETKEAHYMLAEAEVYNQKTEWFFKIEQELQK